MQPVKRQADVYCTIKDAEASLSEASFGLQLHVHITLTCVDKLLRLALMPSQGLSESKTTERLTLYPYERRRN